MDAEMWHWIEILGASLIGLCGWIWTIARKYQAMRNAIDNLGKDILGIANDVARLDGRVSREVEELDARIATVAKERSESSAKIYTRLDEISREQAAQSAQITHIADTCNRNNQALMDLLAGRRTENNPFAAH